MIIGKSLDEVKKITNKDIADQLGGLPPEKMHCSVMGYEALEDALKNYDDYVDLDDLREEPVKEKIICQCFGVTENQIWDAIKHNGLKTVEEVTNYTYYKKQEKDESTSLSPAQKILKISKIIETQIAAELQKDGGDITLVDIDGSKVYVKLRGKCSGCKNAMMTLKGFVENTLKEAVDKNIEVIEVE